MTVTLPNHTGMVTGRRVERLHGRARRHLERRPTHAEHGAGGRGPRRRLGLLRGRRGRWLHRALRREDEVQPLAERSWPRRDRPRHDRRRQLRARRPARRRPATEDRDFTLPAPVAARQRRPRARLDVEAPTCARCADRRARRPRASRPSTPTPSVGPSTTILLTGDHGGHGPTHTAPRLLDNYRIVVHGPWRRRGPRRRPLRHQRDLQEPPRTSRPATPRVASRSATAWSPTWRSTCSTCRPSREASSTFGWTSGSRPNPRSAEADVEPDDG